MLTLVMHAYSASVVRSPVAQIKLLSKWYRLLFQILVVWDTISDWPRRLVGNSFIVRACPQESSLATLLMNILLGPATPQQQWNSFVFHCRPSNARGKSWCHWFMAQYKSAPCHLLWCALACQVKTQSFHTRLKSNKYVKMSFSAMFS